MKTKYCIQLFINKEDKQEWVEAIRVARNILSQPAMDPYNGGESHQDHLYKQMKKFLIGYVKMVKLLYILLVVLNGASVRSNGSCRSINYERHGMENLRVVDASAMPRTTNGNIHAPVLMLAEKAADIIRGKTIRTTIC